MWDAHGEFSLRRIEDAREPRALLDDLSSALPAIGARALGSDGRSLTFAPIRRNYFRAWMPWHGVAACRIFIPSPAGEAATLRYSVAYPTSRALAIFLSALFLVVTPIAMARGRSALDVPQIAMLAFSTVFLWVLHVLSARRAAERAGRSIRPLVDAFEVSPEPARRSA